MGTLGAEQTESHLSINSFPMDAIDPTSHDGSMGGRALMPVIDRLDTTSRNREPFTSNAPQADRVFESFTRP